MAVTGFFGRLKAGLSRSAAKLTGGIAEVFTKRKLDDEALEELEEQLIAADLGPAVAARIIKNFRSTRFGKEVSQQEVRETLAAEISKILAPVALPLEIDTAKKPFVILMAGVNGAGKTTTIGKLAARYREAGLVPMMAAGDTFRAAAVEQLQVWGARAGAEVVTAPANSDAASLAHDALARAQKVGADVLLIDTAGRLHNKTALMEELRKIIRVIRKLDESAPHAVLLTLDATTGQNAVTQVGIFKDMVDLTGLIVTKLDGSARGGIVVALAEKFGLPIHAVGTGEQIADLREFDAEEFARALVGE
jgi:fused signal recognition particle receptor